MLSCGYTLGSSGLVKTNESEVKKKDGNILMTCKAFNARCVMEFLAHELRTAVDSGMHPNNDRLELASVCMNLACT